MSSEQALAGRELLTARDVAFRLNIGERTVWRWVAAGKLPKPIRYSPRLVRWRAHDIEAFVRGAPPTSEQAGPA
jgi:prophage regulatory protein